MFLLNSLCHNITTLYLDIRVLLSQTSGQFQKLNAGFLFEQELTYNGWFRFAKDRNQVRTDKCFWDYDYLLSETQETIALLSWLGHSKWVVEEVQKLPPEFNVRDPLLFMILSWALFFLFSAISNYLMVTLQCSIFSPHLYLNWKSQDQFILEIINSPHSELNSFSFSREMFSLAGAGATA